MFELSASMLLHSLGMRNITFQATLVATLISTQQKGIFSFLTTTSRLFRGWIAQPKDNLH